MTIQKYLLSSVARRPEGEGQGEPPAAPTQDNRSEGEKAFSFDPGEFFVPLPKRLRVRAKGTRARLRLSPRRTRLPLARPRQLAPGPLLLRLNRNRQKKGRTLSRRCENRSSLS
jgi:hypothetical protein